ncbi:hypothetical protein ABTN26_18705, partial [Acinetobacter baumannii]
ISTEHDTAENSIAQDSRHSQADTVTLLFERKWRLILVEIERPDVIIAPRQQRYDLRKTNLANSIEVLTRDRTDGRLSAS